MQGTTRFADQPGEVGHTFFYLPGSWDARTAESLILLQRAELIECLEQNARVSDAASIWISYTQKWPTKTIWQLKLEKGMTTYCDKEISSNQVAGKAVDG